MSIVIIDPGHGGSDPGAVNNSLYEKNINLDIAFRIKNLLQSKSIPVYLTRETDVNLSSSERADFANSKGGTLIVCIHLNATTDSKTNYTKCLYGKKNKDKDFAQHINTVINGALGIPNSGVSSFANGTLLKSNMPATIVETVFISSKEEFALLTDGTGNRQQQIAQLITDGIVSWSSSH